MANERRTDATKLTESELLKIFLKGMDEMIEKEGKDRLKTFPGSALYEDEEVQFPDGSAGLEEHTIGKSRLIYVHTPEGYLTYLVTFEDSGVTEIYNLESLRKVGEFVTADGKWQGLQEIRLSDDKVITCSKIIEIIGEIRRSMANI